MNASPLTVFSVELVDSSSNPIGEFDEIRVADSIFVEHKRGSISGLQIQANRMGITIEAAACEWAERQVFDKTEIRIEVLQVAATTRPPQADVHSVAFIDYIRTFRKMEFQLTETDSRVRTAVQAQIQRLNVAYPLWVFSLRKTRNMACLSH